MDKQASTIFTIIIVFWFGQKLFFLMVIKRKSRRDIGEEIKIYPLETIIIFKRQNKYSEFVQNKLKTFRAFIRKKKNLRFGRSYKRDDVRI